MYLKRHPNWSKGLEKPGSIFDLSHWLYLWPLILLIALYLQYAWQILPNIRKRFFTYRVFLSIATDSNFCSRHGKVYKVTDGDWRFFWITGVDSQDVIAFTHCHGTVARYVTSIAWLRANVYLRHHNVINRQSFSQDPITAMNKVRDKISKYRCSQD